VLRIAFQLTLAVLMLQQLGPVLVLPEGFSQQGLLPQR
jgi:hypothetical protein